MKKGGKRIWWTAGIGIFIVSCCLMVFFVGIGKWDIPAQARRLPDLRMKSEKMGLPSTADDLKPEGHITDRENAGPILTDLVKSHSFNRSYLSILESGNTESEEYDDAVLYLEEIEGLLDSAVSILNSRPKWHIDRDYDQGHALNAGPLNEFVRLSDALLIRAKRRLTEGDIDAAIEDMRALRNLSKNLASEPFIMGLLIAQVADSVAFEILGEVVTVVADDSGRLEQIETLLEETDHRIDPTGALRHEYYAELTLTRNIDRYGGGIAWLKRDLEESDEVGFEPKGSQPLIRSGLPQSVIAQAFQARNEEYWHEVFDVISNSGSPPRGWGMQVSKISDKWRVEPNLSTAMLRLSIGFISVVDSRLMEHDARQNVALAFVRAMRGRAEGNTAPAALGSEPASVDPFNSGQPLGFFFSDDEVRVWSVGANRTDENGEYANEFKGDLVMVWPVSRLVEYRKKP